MNVWSFVIFIFSKQHVKTPYPSESCNICEIHITFKAKRKTIFREFRNFNIAFREKNGVNEEEWTIGLAKYFPGIIFLYKVFFLQIDTSQCPEQCGRYFPLHFWPVKVILS